MLLLRSCLYLPNDGKRGLMVFLETKKLPAIYKNQAEVLSLVSFFARHGSGIRSLSSTYHLVKLLSNGLVFSAADADFSSPIGVAHSLHPLSDATNVTNCYQYSLTKVDTISREFVGLTLGVIIKYTKLSKKIRKNLRGKQRYKAYITLVGDNKVRGGIFRLYKLFSLSVGANREYESKEGMSYFISELYFNGLSHEMIYRQIQKLMLQSYIENGGKAVVPQMPI